MEFLGGVPHNYPMRTKFLILLSVILSLSLVAAPSNAAVKAGAKCTKAGTTATAAGKKFTCVKSGTRLVWNKGVAVKAAPKPSPNPVFKPVEPTPTPTPVVTPTPTPTPTPTVKSFVYQAPSEPSSDVELCKTKEASNSRGMTGAGFPEWNSLTPKTGKVKWALIPLDFADVPGDANFRSRVDDQMKLLSDWFTTVSEGKLTVEWVVSDKWVRMPGRSSDYAIERSDNLDRSTNGLKLWNTAMTQSDLSFDFTGIQTVNFILPLSQTFLKETVQGFPWDAGVKNFITNEGKVDSFSLPGNFMDQGGREYWSYWAHEFGHAIGLPHVGSSRESNPFQAYDLMGTQDGPSRELSGWLRFYGGWFNKERVYCQEVSKLKSVDVTLVPLSDNLPGIKIVVVPVTQTKTLIIESRRVTKFDCTTPTARNGVLAYLYDSKLGHGDAFLTPFSPSERPLERDSCGSKNFSTPPTRDLLIHEGESVTVEGVRVEVLMHGNYDRIRITKP